MSATSIAKAAWEKAVELGIVDGLADTVAAIVAGKTDTALRLAKNTSLAAAAKLAAKERIRRTRGK
jgi:hypothetical protein